MILVNRQTAVLWAIGVLLLFPLFFQLAGGIYNSFEPIYDSGGLLVKLPLPISILACFGGILMLLGNYRRGYLALTTILTMFFLMSISLVFAETGEGIEKSKVMLLLQVMLPTFGLLIGQMVVDTDKIIAKAFLYVLLLVVPAQLAATFLAGSLTLTHNLFIFSIYQHFQYVPLIFVCAFAYATVSLWDSNKKMLIVLTPLMFLYSMASISFLTIFSFIAFISFFTYSKLSTCFNKYLSTVMVVVGVIILVVLMQAYFGVAKSHTNIGAMKDTTTIRFADGGQYVGKIEKLNEGKTPANVLERFEIWKLYGSRITENTTAAFIGHSAPMPREVRTSAHNWYLDMIYNFGLISILPIFWLICFTMYMCWKYRESLSRETLWLAGIVFYLVIIDSNFKVTLRQPYPGIFTYFLWGLLLSALLQNQRIKSNHE